MSDEIKINELVCPDCGNPLSDEYDPGDVCSDCFQAWDGLTTDEIIGLTLGDDK